MERRREPVSPSAHTAEHKQWQNNSLGAGPELL